jgi:hypothetical protein
MRTAVCVLEGSPLSQPAQTFCHIFSSEGEFHGQARGLALADLKASGKLYELFGLDDLSSFVEAP